MDKKMAYSCVCHFFCVILHAKLKPIYNMKKLLIFFAAMMMAAGMTAQGRPAEQGLHERHKGGHMPPPGAVHHEPRGRYIECATPKQLGMAIRVLEQQSFDDKKLEIAELCVTIGHFCVDDLARLAKVFSFDDKRLQFLIYAYDYCEDPQNYYSLCDVFSFRSNFDTLMETVQPGLRR